MKLHQQDGICHVCEKPATFKAPYDLCSGHWAVWWGGNDTSGYMYQQAIKHVRWRDFMNRVPRIIRPLVDWCYIMMERLTPRFERKQTVIEPYPNLKVRNTTYRNGHRTPDWTSRYDCK